MAMMWLTKFSFVFSFISTCCCMTVPLVAWSYGNRNLNSPKNIISGQNFHAEDIFHKYLNPYVESGNKLLIFLQDELSVDDFKIYQSSFKNLKFTLNQQNSFVLPLVSESGKSIYDFAQGTGKIEEVFTSDLSTWSFERLPNNVKVVLFHLEPTSGASAEGRGDILKRNDQSIQTILKAVNLDSFAAVFTASQPSELIRSVFSQEELVAEENSPKRHLLASNNSGSTEQFFNNSGRVFLYFTDIIFLGVSLSGSTWNNNTKGGCSNIDACINVHADKTPEGANVTKFDMSIYMKLENQEWYCNEIVVTATVNETDIKNTFECGASNKTGSYANHNNNVIRAPAHMSYTCHKMIFSVNTTNLQILNLQLQPTIKNDRFGNDYSCTGFYTLEILMGIFVTIIIALGLLVGIAMITTIQTPERFDDPKGASISVPDRE